MKNASLSRILIAALLVFSGCDYRGGLVKPSSEDDSDKPAWAGGKTELNDHRKSNDDTGVSKGSDYGDLYILKRNQDGVPEMGVTSTGVWYPQAVAFDVNGEAVTSNGEYVTLSVNEEGEVDDDTYAPHEVEFGRLNLVRSPESVLTAGLDEAISNLQAGDNITTDFCGRLLAVHGELDWLTGGAEEDDKTIDSPRENLAIYRELMRNGLSDKLSFLLNDGFTDGNILDLAASALAAGSDKTGQITLDEVVYMNGFMQAYDDAASIKLSEISFLNEYTSEWEYCDDDYYSKLKFYDYDYQYDRNFSHGDKWVKITSLNSDGTYVIKVMKLIDVVSFTNTRIDVAHKQNVKVAGFTQACDDAVQILEFLHESSLVEYLGESETQPTL